MRNHVYYVSQLYLRIVVYMQEVKLVRRRALSLRTDLERVRSLDHLLGLPQNFSQWQSYMQRFKAPYHHDQLLFHFLNISLEQNKIEIFNLVVRLSQKGTTGVHRSQEITCLIKFNLELPFLSEY